MPPIRSVALLGAGGTMGQGMARNLASAGLRVHAHNRTREKLQALAGVDGIELSDSVGEAVAGADAFITMLSDAHAVVETVADVLPSNPPSGTIWLQMSTIGVEGTDRCIEIAKERGLPLIDAPVLGTKKPAQDGELVVLASGPGELRGAVEPVFDAVGKRTMWVGEAGKSTRLKLAINSWIVSVVEGTAEMLSLAEGLDIDPQLPLDAVAEGPLDLPYLQLKAKAMIEQDFTPSFRLALAAKDASLAVEAAEDAGLDLTMLEAIRDRMAAAVDEHGDEDLAATYLLSKPPSRP